MEEGVDGGKGGCIGAYIVGYPERYYVVPVRYYVVPNFFRVLWYYGRVLYSIRGY